MTLFQWVSLSVLGVLLLWEVVGLCRSRAGWGVRALRALVWGGAAAAIAHPEGVQWLGSLLGIGRGADLVLYLSVLGFLGVSFYFYSRNVRIERQLTEVVRQMALRDPRRGESAPPRGE
jgi:hypothetical protein